MKRQHRIKPKYRVVSSASYWYGRVAQHLRRDVKTQLVRDYLSTGPLANMIGLYRIAPVTIALDLGLTERAVRKALVKLQDLGYLRFDFEIGLVFIPEMAPHQIAPTLNPDDNRVTGVLQLLAELGDHAFVEEFKERYGDAFCLNEPPLRDDLTNRETARTPAGLLRSPSEAPSEPLRSQEQEQEQEDRIPPKSPPAGGVPLPDQKSGADLTPDDLNRLRLAWNDRATFRGPRVRNAWRDLQPTPDLDEVIRAMTADRRDAGWREKNRNVTAGSYLRNECWKERPAEPPSPPPAPPEPPRQRDPAMELLYDLRKNQGKSQAEAQAIVEATFPATPDGTRREAQT